MTNFFKNKDGQVVLWQSPNLALWGWIAFKLVGLVVGPGHFKDGVGQLATAFLFVWAFLEITKGDSYFRRLLGLVVGVFIIIGFFK